jgi:NAD(P)-dependent dehydrogenase (short-subunit alcohol dehydrogenase family)
MNPTHAPTAQKNVALITGANRGLGYATAQLLGEAGITVLVGSRDRLAGEQAAERLREDGIDAHSVHIDVTSEPSVRQAAVDVAAEHGRLDILVNNAGILPEATTADIARPLDMAMFRESFDTNVFGAVSVTKEFLPMLREAPAGRIVNVSSTMGSLADQSDPDSTYYALVVPAYQTSKAALNGLTVALSKSLGDTKIKVNSVCPGWVQTDLGGPDNRAAAPTTARTAARIVAEMAMIDDTGPTGGFFDDDGTVPW